MQTTLSPTTNPVIEISHKHRNVLLAALAALAVTVAVTVAAATVTDGPSRLTDPAPMSTPWIVPQYGPGSNSLSMTDPAPTQTPWIVAQHGPGSNSLSVTDPRG